MLVDVPGEGEDDIYIDLVFSDVSGFTGDDLLVTAQANEKKDDTDLMIDQKSGKTTAVYQTESILQAYGKSGKKQKKNREVAYAKNGKEYSVYYIFNTSKKTVKQFITNESTVFKGKYSGSFKKKITIKYSEDTGIGTQYMQGVSTGKKLVIKDYGGKVVFHKVKISKARKALKKVKHL